MNIKIIKNCFKNYNKKQIAKNLPKILKNNPEIELYLNYRLAKEPNWLNIRNLVYSIVFNEYLTRCEFCGKELNYYQSIRHNHRFCSNRCKKLAEGYHSLTNNYVKLLTPKSDYDGLVNGKIYKFKCLHCGHEFEAKQHHFNYFPENYTVPPCPKCFTNSFIQTKVFNSLVEHFGSNYTFIQNDRNLLSNHVYKNKHVPEIDIVVYKGNVPILGIEVNSSWTHSKQCYNAKHCKFNINMHLNKVKWANEIGLRLINIWDWELDEGINKTIKILEGRESLTFTDKILQLDRSWYNNIEIPGYTLIGDIAPTLINHNGYDIADCGKLVYNKKLGV